jgi:hypothetical protein
MKYRLHDQGTDTVSHRFSLWDKGDNLVALLDVSCPGGDDRQNFQLAQALVDQYNGTPQHLLLDEEELTTIEVCVENQQPTRITPFEIRELVRVYRVALARRELEPNDPSPPSRETYGPIEIQGPGVDAWNAAKDTDSATVNAHQGLVEALREARSMLRACGIEDPEGEGADIQASWDRGLARIDAALSKLEGQS